MHPLERQIYDILKKNPHLKNRIVDLYQRLFAVIPTRNQLFGHPIKTREGFFFGFHDKCPWSYDNQFLLAHRCGELPLKMPGPNEAIEIGIFSGNEYDTFHPLAKSKAWNWQTGAMLQWIADSDRIVFNDFEADRVVARIIKTTGAPVKTLPRPVAAVSPCGKWALSHGFERLRIGAPGYEYANGVHAEEKNPVAKNDGMYVLDLKSETVYPLFTVEQIARLKTEAGMQDAFHFFSHCQFSPSGERFIFYHRWLLSNGLLCSRMLSSDINGKNVFVFPTNGMVSHMCWQDDDHVLAYASTQKYGDKYHLFEDRSEHYQVFGLNLFRTDGHPQFSPDRHDLLTDTYPDRYRRQSLLCFDTQKEELHTLLKLRIPLKYRYSVRCDYHPRWNRDGSMICFDSAHTGKRSLCTIVK